ncbi:ATP-binding cassette domain-containing protein [Enterococcus casseliflavus]|nr:ATP-binding cassette domain-containing protein [Enterococcus casseliflavus]
MLEVRNLSFSYQNELILENITQEFHSGMIHTILGQSGVGKSTFLSLISGLEFLQDGNIYFEDEEISNLVNYRKKISYIFQNFNLIPFSSPIDNLKIALEIHKVTNSHSPNTYLDRLGIVGELQSKKCSQLSGGQQQRVAIARALALNSNLIIADEPTGSLDLENSKNVMSILKNLRDQGKCIIIVSHDLSFKEISDNVYTIEERKLKKIQSFTGVTK